MDYIREELLRQQRALAALMAGGETLETEAALGAASDVNSVETGTGAAAAWSGRGRGASPAAPEYTANGPGGETGRAPVADTAAEETAGPERSEEAGVSGRRRAGSGGLWAGGGQTGLPPQDAWGGGTAGAPGAFTAEAAALWEAAGVPAGGGAASSARELSLAVQRDARRYDGGFSLY